MKLLKNLMIISLISIISWFFYIKLTNQTTQYVCLEKKSFKTAYLYIDIEEKYPWTSLWSEFNGKLTAHISTGNSLEYNYKLNDNNLMELYKKGKLNLQGKYSTIDNILNINTQDISFKGSCSICKDYCVNNIMH